MNCFGSNVLYISQGQHDIMKVFQKCCLNFIYWKNSFSLLLCQLSLNFENKKTLRTIQFITKQLYFNYFYNEMLTFLKLLPTHAFNYPNFSSVHFVAYLQKIFLCDRVSPKKVLHVLNHCNSCHMTSRIKSKVCFEKFRKFSF